MSALIWMMIACGYVGGIVAGLAVIAWEAAREGYTRGFRRIVGTPVEIEDDDA